MKYLNLSETLSSANVIEMGKNQYSFVSFSLLLPLASPEADGGLYSAGLATASPYQDPGDSHSGQDYAGLDPLDQAAFLGLNFDTDCKYRHIESYLLNTNVCIT